MSRFYSSVTSKRTTHTKCGTISGMTAHLRGWHIGVRINLYVDSDGRDRIVVSRTGGSLNPASTGIITELTDVSIIPLADDIYCE